jgi:hypothetical protein
MTAILCTQGGELGILAPVTSITEAATWENAIHSLCVNGGEKVSTWHAEIAGKYARYLLYLNSSVIYDQNLGS